MSFLNLPSMVNTLTYSYLSDGTKLSIKKSNGSSIVYRGSFVYDVSARNIVTLESVGIPEGRVYCSDTPDGELWECWDIKDYLGNVRAVVRSDNGSPIEISDYLPYGTRLEEYNPPYQVGNNRWHYAGKENQQFGGYDEADLIDFGARYYSLGIGRWTSLDPKAWNYTSTSPYNYCNNNPVNFVDPNGEAWGNIEYNDGSFIIFWIDNEYVTDSEGNLYPGFYDSMVAFVPGKEFDPGNPYNIGSSIAIVCDIEGNVSFFDACTYPSNLEKYPTIPEGSYEAMKGMHKNKYPALKMFDIGKDLSNNTIELGFVNPAYTDGRTYVSGGNIHMAGINNLTTEAKGKPVISQACFLIDRNRWNEFMSHFYKLPNSSKIGIIVRR